MGIYRLNENLSVRLKALQLYIYWGALRYIIKPFQGTPQNYHLVVMHYLSIKRLEKVS